MTRFRKGRKNTKSEASRTGGIMGTQSRGNCTSAKSHSTQSLCRRSASAPARVVGSWNSPGELSPRGSGQGILHQGVLAEARLTAWIDTMQGEAAAFVTLRHGKLTYDLLAGSAIVEDVSAACRASMGERVRKM